MSWQIETYTSFEALAPILPQWEALAARMQPWSPFATPTWNALWWKHYSRRGLLRSDELFLQAVRGEDGRLVAIAPLLRWRSPAFGPLALHAIDFFGADPSITEIRGVICDPADQAAIVTELRQFLHRSGCRWDLLRWQGLRSLPPPVSGRGGPLQTGALPDYVLRLPASWQQLLAGVSSNMRKSVRKAYEFLERDGHAFAFRAVDAPSGALDEFFRLHGARAGVADMHFKHPDRFGNPTARAFMTDVANAMARQGRLKIFELEIGGEIVASRLAFLHERELYLYYSGYDPAWRKYSIMTTLMSEILRWGIGQGLAVVNLSTGNDLSKLRWQPEEICYLAAEERRSGWRGRMLSCAFEATTAARRAVFWAKGYRSGSVATSDA
jgi:CelD/BcsL family acetyltransferase involved in cellulose biosynthesis